MYVNKYIAVKTAQKNPKIGDKIRISAHPLMIEQGRHLNIPRTERYCLLCKSNQIKLKMKNIFSYIVKNSILKETYLMKKYQIYLKMQVIKMLTTKYAFCLIISYTQFLDWLPLSYQTV